MNHEKILFFPENYTKKLKSMSKLKSNQLLLTSSNPSNHSSGLRKNLPQTSNRFLRTKTKAKPKQKPEKVLQTLTTSSDLTEDFDIYSKLSPNLSKLLKKVSKLYKDCEIIPDNSFPEFGLYSYLFDSHCRRIDKFSDIKSKPDFLFISCRFNLAELIFPGDSKQKLDQISEKTVNYVNLYSSVIVDDKNTQGVSLVRRKTRSPVYKLKTLHSAYKICRTPEIKAYPACTEVKHIFPCASGKKIKEGTGGFRKPQLIFDKRKTSLSPTPGYDRSIETVYKNHYSPARVSFKETLE